jgi:hypothetical protein
LVSWLLKAFCTVGQIVVYATFPSVVNNQLQIECRYEQDSKTRRWYIKPEQTDNLASPWDLTTSSDFVHPSNIAAFAYEVPVLGTAEQVLAYISKTEAAIPFRHHPAKDDPGYHRIIPESATMSLSAMDKRLSKGEYAAAAGLKRMWEDLKRIIHNAKKRHQQAHWEWRAADMLEKELRAVRKAMRPGKGSLDAAKAAIPHVRPRPGTAPRKRGSRSTSGAASKRSKVVLSAKSLRGGSRRVAATTALLTMATSVTDTLEWEAEGDDDDAAKADEAVAEAAASSSTSPRRSAAVVADSDADDDDDDESGPFTSAAASPADE